MELALAPRICRKGYKLIFQYIRRIGKEDRKNVSPCRDLKTNTNGIIQLYISCLEGIHTRLVTERMEIIKQ